MAMLQQYLEQFNLVESLETLKSLIYFFMVY